MLNQRINPFAAILAFTVIAAVGTYYVVQKISDTDLTYAHTDTRVGVNLKDLIKSH